MKQNDLVDYINTHILQRYKDFDTAHGPDHVQTVLKNSLEIAHEYDVDEDMVYAIAAYHDTGLSVDRKNHHLTSGAILEADTTLRKWFTDEQVEIMKQAVEDHRASNDTEPRSIYGRIIAEADRDIRPEIVIYRCAQYGLSNYPDYDLDMQYERIYDHMCDKYGDNGYLKLWLNTGANARGLAELRRLINDKPACINAVKRYGGFDKIEDCLLLVNREFTFKPADAKTHLPIEFDLDWDFEELHIYTEYSPKDVTDEALCKDMINDALDRFVPADKRANYDWHNFVPVKNHITISLDYKSTTSATGAYKYIGCAHRHDPVLHHIISSDFASPGFEPHSAVKGRYRVVLSLHNVSKDAFFKLRVEARKSIKPFYKPFELHSHTIHSDGRFTVRELCEAARDAGLFGIALTDHNSFSGHRELTDTLASETLPVVRGIEWTTFYGHMLALNTSGFVDWREAGVNTPDDRAAIDAHMRALKRTGAVVGIAHPFCFGNPICTGCRWDFDIADKNNIDYMEVWSRPFQDGAMISSLATEWWTQLLNDGCRIAAVSGKDWHGPDNGKPLNAVTYLGLTSETSLGEAVAHAIRCGRTYISAGPCLELCVIAHGINFRIGDEMPSGAADFDITLHKGDRYEQWAGFDIKPTLVRIINNGNIITEQSIEPDDIDCRCVINTEVRTGWVRVEVYGADQLIALTSALYVTD